jgi:peptidyl-prolyl cis-trans isomerase C
MRRYSRTKNSTKIFVAATVVAAVVFGVSQFFSCCEDFGEVVAKVNGQKIYRVQVENKLTLLLGGAPNQKIELPALESLPKEVVEILVKEIYLDEELSKIAKKSDATKTDEVKSRLKEAKNSILRQAYVDSLIKEDVTDEKISQKYTELSSELQSKKEYSLSHIVVKTKDEAEKVSKELKTKKRFSFSDAAKKYSLDKDSAVAGGDLGFVLENNLIKEIADELVKMKKGQISEPIQTKFGWHLVKFSDVRDAKALPFEEVKENIRQQLIKDILEETKSNLTKDIKIEIILKSPTEEKPLEEKEVKKSNEEIAPLDETASEDKPEVKLDESSKTTEPKEQKGN